MTSGPATQRGRVVVAHTDNRLRVLPQERVESDRVVNVYLAGVCGTDIQILRRTRPDSASVLGHEAVGVLGDGVAVVFNPMSPQDQDKILGHTVDGVFRSTVPLADDWPRVLPVRTELSVESAVFTEPVACALYTQEIVRANVMPTRVAVWGAGPQALIQGILFGLTGAEVLVIHPSADRRRWVRERLPDLELVLADDVRLRMIDVAVLCVPGDKVQGAIDEALCVIRHDGVLVLVAGPSSSEHPRLPGVDIQDVRRRNIRGEALGCATTVDPVSRRSVRVTGHRGTSDRQLLEAQRLLLSIGQRLERLVTHRLPPHEAVAVIRQRVTGRGEDHDGRVIGKILVDFSDNL